MPPKRRRDVDDEEGSIVTTPRTPKKARTDAAAATASGSNGRNGTRAATADSGDSDEGLPAGQLTEEEDDDELAFAQVTQSSRVKSATPRKTRTRRQRDVHDTPSKSTARRRTGQGLKTVDVDGEDDVAANLILQVADRDERQEEKAPVVTNGVSLEEGGFEAYFEQSARKQKTSNNTLSKLPSLAHNEYLKILKSYRLPYGKAMQALYDSHVEAFPEWSFEMEQEYSLCLFGYGSKKSLIQEFCAKEADEYGYPYVVINGYHPNIDLRQICQSITGGLRATGADVDAVLEAIDAMQYERLTLAIHNLDGSNIQSDKIQTQIARIVAHPKIRMICSIDHVNAPLLFSSTRTTDLHLLFHDATTFEPYTVETELQPDVLSSSTKTALVGDRGIKWILQTLSQNARTIFRILLTEQIETGQGMDSTRLFEKASSAFAVSNKTSYNAQMGEFLDHEIIVTERGSESNAEVMRIPFTKTELQRLLEDIDGGDVSEE